LPAAAHQDNPRYLTAPEAAYECRVHIKTLYVWINEGRLPARRVGRRWLVARSDLDAILDPPA
jgi:excisionase family DNA binding protein